MQIAFCTFIKRPDVEPTPIESAQNSASAYATYAAHATECD